MIRLFVAIELPEAPRRRMAMMESGVRDARWVDIENLHLTLRFIGDTQEDRVEDIGRALEGVRGEPFDLVMAGVGHFESRRLVRVLWAGVEPNPPLMALQERIETALMRAGCAPEGRRFLPHVTLARLKAAKPAHVRRWLEANALFRAEPVAVSRFTLFQSQLGHGGAHYRVLGEYGLSRNAAAAQGGASGAAARN